MSVKDLNTVLIVTSALTGIVYFTMSKEDYLYNDSANSYFNSKVNDLIRSGDGAIIKEGYKN